MSIGSVSLQFIAARLNDRSDLASSLGAGVLSSAPSSRPEDVADALALREALSRCFRAAAERVRLPDRDVATVNSYASEEPPMPVLRVDGSVVRGATDPVRAGLAAIARDAIETLAFGSGDLRLCEDPACGRIFLDRSRGRRRRWCSMRSCGNRAKVAAYRKRRA